MPFLHHPWGLVAALVYIYLLVVIRYLGNKRPGIGVLWSAKTCLAVAIPLFVLTFVYGFFPQSEMHRKWYYILALFLFATVVGLAAMDGLFKIVGKGFSWKGAGITLAHLSIFLVLSGGLFGCGDTRHVVVSATEGESVSAGVDEDTGEMVSLPFRLSLDKFTFEKKGNRPYFLSEITLTGKDGVPAKYGIMVNHPLKTGSWTLYQYDYGKSDDGRNVSVFECVSDPWSGFIRAALWMLMASAAMMVVMALTKKKKEGEA